MSKDPLGDKLRDKEKAEEDRYFAERDKELARKFKEKMEREAAEKKSGGGDA